LLCTVIRPTQSGGGEKGKKKGSKKEGKTTLASSLFVVGKKKRGKGWKEKRKGEDWESPLFIRIAYYFSAPRKEKERGKTGRGGFSSRFVTVGDESEGREYRRRKRGKKENKRISF